MLEIQKPVALFVKLRGVEVTDFEAMSHRDISWVAIRSVRRMPCIGTFCEPGKAFTMANSYAHLQRAGIAISFITITFLSD